MMNKASASSGSAIAALEIGWTASLERTVTAADIDAFAALSGDVNPVHLDAAYAGTTRFGGRIAHGMLSASIMSALLGTRLPGPPAVYVSQSLRFLAPVRIGDRLIAEVAVTALDRDRGRAWLATRCRVGETLVLDGEAELALPRERPGLKV